MLLILRSGWDAGIRTPIRSSRGCSLTVRRRPNKTETLFYQTQPRESTTPRIVDWKFKMRNCLRVSVLLGLFASAGSAVDWKALKAQGYVSDFARVIDPASKSQLEAYCATVERSTGAQMALVTIATLAGEPIEDVANTIYRAWGVGQKGKNEGALLLLVVGDRRNRLEVGYGLEPIVPDGFAGSVLREMRPALKQQLYGEALMAAAETIGVAVAP